MNDTPTGWTRTTLGKLGDYHNGRGFKKAEWRSSGRPIIRIQNLTGTSSIHNYFQGEVDPRNVAHTGDLLVSWAATLGTYFWNGPEAVVNQHIFKVESKIDKRFHKYLLDFKLAELMRETHGSGMVHITRSKFDALEVSLPDRDEQHRIVDILEDHLSSLDAAELLLDKSFAKMHRLRQAIVDTEISGATTTGVQSSSLPAGWQLLPPGDFAKGGDRGIVIGPFGSDLKTSDYRDEGVPLIFVRDVRTGSFANHATRFVSHDKAKALASHSVEQTDILVTKMGDPPGDASVYTRPEPGIVTADVIRIRPTSGVSPEFLMHAINSSAVKSQILAITSGVAQKKVSLGRFRSAVRIPMPPPPEQARIAARIDLQLASLEGTRLALLEATRRSAALRTTLLSSAFSGGLLSSLGDSVTHQAPTKEVLA